MDVGQSLSQVAAQAVLAVLKRLLGEERHVLQGHRVGAGEEDAQVGLRLGARRLDGDLIFLPVLAVDVELHLREILALIHGLLVDQLHANLRLALGSLGPDGEAVFLALLHADAEEALVLQTRAALAVAGVAEHDVVGAALEGTVVFKLYVAEDAPAHVVLGKLKGAVLHQLAVESAVGSKVDVFEKQTVHR